MFVTLHVYIEELIDSLVDGGNLGGTRRDPRRQVTKFVLFRALLSVITTSNNPDLSGQRLRRIEVPSG